MLQIAGEVRDALARGQAVVALESTIIAHGLPHPQNLAIAHDLEAAVRAHGAVPATIAVLAGIPRIGLDTSALEQLARGGKNIAKAGAADLAAFIATGRDAATTVSATALLAARAGIRLFATGGIGGVHRGSGRDVSNDLETLARVPVAVVSAGAKAILDLPQTLEMLETLGVLVAGFDTSDFPAFYTRRSGLVLEHRVADAAAAARLLQVRFDELGQNGVLIANPIPAHAAMDADQVAAAIARAMTDAEAAGITGKKLTPYLLARLAEVTGGASIAANRALAIHNAEVAADIAVAYSRLVPATRSA